MTIEIVTALPAASSPSHPDHTRWVKEQMLARERSWLRGLGLEVTARASEDHINEGMRRLAARKREQRVLPQVRPAKEPTRDPNENVAHGLARDAGYKFRKRAPRKAATPPPPWDCGKCGACVRCRRELRAMNVLRMARAGDEQLKPLAMKLIGASLRAQMGAGEFTGLAPHDVNRVLTRVVEDVCDASAAFAGPWR